MKLFIPLLLSLLWLPFQAPAQQAGESPATGGGETATTAVDDNAAAEASPVTSPVSGETAVDALTDSEDDAGVDITAYEVGGTDGAENGDEAEPATELDADIEALKKAAHQPS